LAISINRRLCTHILQENHNIEIARHLGISKTIEVVMRKFYWPRIGKNIKKYIQTCDACKRNKANNHIPAGLLQPLPTPNKR
jgi:hypothetical protein